jgi:hypothetical protein
MIVDTNPIPEASRVSLSESFRESLSLTTIAPPDDDQPPEYSAGGPPPEYIPKSQYINTNQLKYHGWAQAVVTFDVVCC